jgi:hypothetical protein
MNQDILTVMSLEAAIFPAPQDKFPAPQDKSCLTRQAVTPKAYIQPSLSF